MNRSLVLVVASIALGCGSGTGDSESDSGTSVADAALPQEPVCEAEGANANITGTTPEGTVDLSYGFVGNTAWDGHDCYDLRLLFSSDATVDGWEPEGLELYIGSGSGVEVVSGPTLPVDVIWRTSAGQIATTGTVVLETYDAEAPSARGTLRIETEGWSVTGTFQSGHCTLIDDNCI